MKKVRKISILSIIVFICSVFWLMPLLLIFINSFKPYNDMLQEFLALPKSWSLNMYIETWTKFDFPLLIGNTLLYTVCTVLIIALLAPMAAYKLARTKGRLSGACFVLIIIPMMVPFQSYMITLTRLVANLGMTGSKIGYILVSTGLCMPLAVYMIHGFVKNVPIELEECACIDGAGKVRTYFNIVLPLLKPILTTVVVLDTLATWNDIITNQLIVGGNAILCTDGRLGTCPSGYRNVHDPQFDLLCDHAEAYRRRYYSGSSEGLSVTAKRALPVTVMRLKSCG